ncbi:carboxymuconolactone decarboxylase family protein [Cesiribacter sp. SM1]|uniref:carboxymuconolactone decarboxylase family protein n=1 Tax=Cesiribacter sp. SM1 TaxID=2861196 RepID=UPI001CD5EF08|nr:carboxymuconolactone decarboxylase family protein [Cesiribacter sp. SM1]
MEARIIIKEVAPEAYKAMHALERYLRNTSIDFSLKELIKIRASQINGCAYCIQIHTTDARKAGETEQRIYALSAWRESPLFTEKEKAALAVTEEVTKISDRGLSKKTYSLVKQHFSENEIAEIIMQVVTINAWNRIAVATHLKHSHQ